VIGVLAAFMIGTCRSFASIRRAESSCARRSRRTEAATTRLSGYYRNQQPEVGSFPEKTAATYELLQTFNPSAWLGDTSAFVRPLLKKTQLERRNLQVSYDANRHGWNARTFHQKVDGKGAAVVLVKVQGQWLGGYNGRGWASLGGSRPSVAAFLFYKTLLGWQKLRVKGGGGMACGRDEFDQGIYFGADGLVIPLNGDDRRAIASRLGMYYESCPKTQRGTLLPGGGGNLRCQELKVLTGVYGKDEDIPNSGGVTDLGLY
jgi:hypothetical protein